MKATSSGQRQDPLLEQVHSAGVGFAGAYEGHAEEAFAGGHAGENLAVSAVSWGDDAAGGVSTMIDDETVDEAGLLQRDFGAEIPGRGGKTAGLMTIGAVHGEVAAGTLSDGG